MGYVVQKVEIYDKSGDTWLDTGQTITDAFNIEIKKGTGKIKNTFSFKVPFGKSFFQSSTNPFRNENLVKIYIVRDTTSFADTDLQIEGVINSVEQSIDDRGDVLIIKGNDFTEVLFDTALPLDEQEKTWIDIIKNILGFLQTETAKQVYWADSDNGYVGTANPTTQSGGSEFPLKTLILNFTKVSEIIEKLTSDEFTEDGQYIYWIEKQNDKFFLICKFKDNTIAGTITEGDDSFDIKISKKNEDIKNFIIFNCGNDLYGRSIEDVYYGTFSIGKVGFKYYYATEETSDIFTNLWNTERNYPTKIALFNPDSEGKPQDDFPTAYSYTFATIRNYDAETNTWSDITAADDKEFNDALVEAALFQGRNVSIRIAKASATPQYSLEYVQRFTNEYALGEQYQCNFPSRNINRPLRIEEIQQSVDETKLIFIEDETKAEFD